MAEGFKRGEVGSQVNSWMPSTNTVTPSGFTSSIAPFGLQLRQTINAGTTSVTIPAGITFVYAIAVGSGGGGGQYVAGATGGGAGGNNSSGSGGRSGGSGIVVLSYPSIFAAAASTTGSPTVSAINSNRIYTFTGSGSITF